MAASKDRAEKELRAFYGEVLPTDLSAARKVTYMTLAQLARKTNLKVVRRAWDEDQERDSALARLQVGLVLEGQYEDMRAFVYQLETAPEFVIIDDVTIDQVRDGGTALSLRLQLSTYYRAAGNGT